MAPFCFYPVFAIYFFCNCIFVLCRPDQEVIVFEFPDNPNDLYRNQKENVIDSIEVVKDSWIATKIALHGVIYIFDLNATYSKIKNNKGVVKPECILKWSDTDNYFMSCGVGLGTHFSSTNKTVVTAY